MQRTLDLAKYMGILRLLSIDILPKMKVAELYAMHKKLSREVSTI